MPNRQNIFEDEPQKAEKPAVVPKKPKIWKTALKIAGSLFGLIALNSSMYTVDQTEQAIVTQFGKPVRCIVNPIDGKDREQKVNELKQKYASEGISCSEGAGLRFKIPFIQSVRAYERRLLRWNGFPEQIPTKDKKYIWVDPTARWYIDDPLQFLRSVGTEEQAHARLDDIVDSTTRNSITKRDLLEVVRTDNRKMAVAEEELKDTTKVGDITEGRPQIVKEINAQSKEACKEYGIGIHEEGVLIKGLTYVEGVKEEVEKRMIEERLRIAKKYTSEGDGTYQKIMGDKEREVKRISSEAYKTAQLIRGNADAEATRIYASGFTERDPATEKDTSYRGFNADPEFYGFWRTLQLYEESMGGQKTRLVLRTGSPLLQIMTGEGVNTPRLTSTQPSK